MVKLIKTNKNGIPDLLATKKDRTVFVEVKQEHGILTPVQKYRINEIRNKNIECYIWIGFGINFDKQDPHIFKL